MSLQVEVMVMRALSLGLVKGSIDQVAGAVSVTWVQPRVLDRGQVSQECDERVFDCKSFWFLSGHPQRWRKRLGIKKLW